MNRVDTVVTRLLSKPDSKVFESYDDRDYNAHADLIEREYNQFEEIANLLKDSKGEGKLPWKTISASLLKRVWLQFGKWNRINENDLDKIADQILTNIARLLASTEMMGHTPRDVRPELEDYGITFTDEEWHEWMPDYFTDERGNWLLSDCGLNPLLEIYVQIFNADTPEEKLYACDRALNVIHQRSDLAALFVQGGTATLSEIASQGGPEVPEIEESLVSDVLLNEAGFNWKNVLSAGDYENYAKSTKWGAIDQTIKKVIELARRHFNDQGEFFKERYFGRLSPEGSVFYSREHMGYEAGRALMWDSISEDFHPPFPRPVPVENEGGTQVFSDGSIYVINSNAENRAFYDEEEYEEWQRENYVPDYDPLNDG